VVPKLINTQRGPGHYYCGPLEAGLDEQVLSNIVMPAADAVVDLTLSGQPLKFNGNGYHDKVSYISYPFALVIVQIVQLLTIWYLELG
jgi:hypothetical protein